MTSRGLPAPPDELPELPSAKLGTKSLWRIHAADVASWFFDIGPDGRFNLAESGTCYLAEEPIGAFVEKLGHLLRPDGVIPEQLVDSQRLSRLRPPKASVVNLTQDWALTFQEAGYAGIRYKARHDPRGQLPSVALFGSEKPPQGVAKTTAIPIDLIHQASTTFAIAVLPRRHSRRG